MPALVPTAAFAIFDQQDSGCLSYGIARGGRRLFVKTATTSAGRRSLGRAITFHRSVDHPAIVSPIDVIDTDDRRQLTYRWVDGVVLNHATVGGADRSGLHLFRRLPVDEILGAVHAILDAHRAVARTGFVSVDLYDGCFLYDFDEKAMHLIDLDEYRPGPFVSHDERLPGSARYMAPEEFERGATITQRTTVFHLGRTVAELLGASRCSAAQRSVVDAATSDRADLRFDSVEEMVDAWSSAAC